MVSRNNNSEAIAQAVAQGVSIALTTTMQEIRPNLDNPAPNRLYSIQLRVFDGSDGQTWEDWCSHVEEKMKLHRVSDETDIANVARTFLAGTAAAYRKSLPEDSIKTWEELKTMFSRRFGRMVSQQHRLHELLDLKQADSIESHVNNFIGKLATVNRRPDDLAIVLFQRSCKAEIASDLRRVEASTLEEACRRAIQVAAASSQLASSTSPVITPQPLPAITSIEALRVKKHGVRCFGCGRMGHIAKDCRAKKKGIGKSNPYRKPVGINSLEADELILGAYEATNKPRLVYMVHLLGQRVHFLIDTGAEASVIDRGLCVKLQIPLKKVDIMIRAVGGSRPIVYGKTDELEFKIGKLISKWKFIVTDYIGHDGILGMDWLVNVGAVIDAKNRSITIDDLPLDGWQKNIKKIMMIDAESNQKDDDVKDGWLDDIGFKQILCNYFDCVFFFL